MTLGQETLNPPGESEVLGGSLALGSLRGCVPCSLSEGPSLPFLPPVAQGRLLPSWKYECRYLDSPLICGSYHLNQVICS